MKMHFNGLRRHQLLAGFCAILFSSLALAAPAQPAGAKGRVAIVGDSLAQDLWFGFRDLYGNSGGRTYAREVKAATGLVKREHYNWNTRAAQVASAHYDVAIVMIGGNDRQNITTAQGKQIERFTPGWFEAYRARVDEFTKILKSKISRIYWVGLPKVRSEQMSGDYRHMNAIFKAAAEANGAVFIDIWGWSSANQGLLRGDGLHFSSQGTVQLAKYVSGKIF